MSLIDHRPILIVEDNDEDFEATMWAFRKTSIEVPVVRCVNGVQAIEYLEQGGVHVPGDAALFPVIALLDLNLPGMGGHQVLKHIKRSEKLNSLPVVVLTTSVHPADVEGCYQHGANSYIVKPANLTKMREVVQELCTYWLRLVLLPTLKVSRED